MENNNKIEQLLVKNNLKEDTVPVINSDSILENIWLYKWSTEWINIFNGWWNTYVWMTLDSNIWYSFLLDTWLVKHEFSIVKSNVSNKTSWFPWILWALDWWEIVLKPSMKTVVEQSLYLFTDDDSYNWFTPTDDKKWKDYWYFLWEIHSERNLFSITIVFKIKNKTPAVKRVAKRIAKAKGVYIDSEKFKVVEACYRLKKPCLLMWPTWCWKTTIIRQLWIDKKHWVTRINLNWEITKEDLVWSKTLENWNVVWKDWPLVSALREWKIILLDELNAALPEVLLLLQSLTEASDWKLWELRLNENNWEVIVPHVKCRIFATWNPSDEYIWTKDFNPATLSRWIVINIEYLNRADEIDLLCWKYSIKLWLSQDFIMRLVDFWKELRRIKKEDEITYSLSTRDLEQTIEMVWMWIKLWTSIESCIKNKAQNSDDKNKIQSCIDIVFKKEDLNK